MMSRSSIEPQTPRHEGRPSDRPASRIEEQSSPTNTEALRLVPFIVSVVVTRTHRVPRHIIRHRSAQPICAQAAGSEVNAAKNARVDDFRCRLREARIGTSARAYLRGDGERGVLSKRGSKDESR